MNKYDNVKSITFANKDNNSSIKARLKSKMVWVSVVSLLLPLLGHLGLYQKTGITENSLKIIIDAVLSILVIVGILNNPVDSEKF